MREILSQKYSGGRILLLEHNSHFASVLSTICLQSNVDLVTAEYFGDRYKSGEIINSVLHVDIQDSHFPDNYFDLILHTDVFEHLPDAPKGEQETVRILKPGGCSVFTAPFDYAAMEDHIFAEIINGATVYHRDPIYHHDPVAPDGKCLLFRIFAFSTLQQRFNKLGCSFVCNYLHSKYMGILGNNGFCFVASKL
jgi:SAM-dependent methyltransferase